MTEPPLCSCGEPGYQQRPHWSLRRGRTYVWLCRECWDEWTYYKRVEQST